MTSGSLGISCTRAPEIGAERAQPQTRQGAVEPEKGAGVGARLQDRLVALANAEQGAVRLDAAGEMDLLTLAVRQIGVAEGRRGLKLRHASSSLLRHLAALQARSSLYFLELHVQRLPAQAEIAGGQRAVALALRRALPRWRGARSSPPPPRRSSRAGPSATPGRARVRRGRRRRRAARCDSRRLTSRITRPMVFGRGVWSPTAEISTGVTEPSSPSSRQRSIRTLPCRRTRSAITGKSSPGCDSQRLMFWPSAAASTPTCARSRKVGLALRIAPSRSTSTKASGSRRQICSRL